VTPAPILPPATLGILGGGQLGRFFVIAAKRMGYRVVVLEPEPHSPAGVMADEHIVADYVNPTALDRLASQCAVVTTEFENAPAEALDFLAERTAVHPPPRAVGFAQDRREEKHFLNDLGIATAPFVVIESEADLALVGHIGYPAILKTARLGYDGKGQTAVADAGEVAAAWAAFDHVACVLEERVPLDAEVSVMIARTAAGITRCYPITRNEHRGGILDVSVAPVVVPGAVALAEVIAHSLDYVGVLGVEMFISEGRLLVNELAPRPHNSYHWTLDAAITDQFEQQVRAVCGLPLGDVTLTVAAVAMANLLGDEWSNGAPRWVDVLADDGVKLHLYGKAEARPGRKMGHLTVADMDIEAAAHRVRAARRRVSGSADSA
jgi:5-(carboxyamino)imidazole ribonucleotide synthase